MPPRRPKVVELNPPTAEFLPPKSPEELAAELKAGRDRAQSDRSTKARVLATLDTPALLALGTWLPSPPEGDSSFPHWVEAMSFCREVVLTWPGGEPPIAIVSVLATAGMQLVSSRSHYDRSFRADEKEDPQKLRLEASRLADASRTNLLAAYRLNTLHLAAKKGLAPSPSEIADGLQDGIE